MNNDGIGVLIALLFAGLTSTASWNLGYDDGAKDVISGKYTCQYVELNDSWQCGIISKPE